MATIEVCARKGHAYDGLVEKAHSYLVITYDDGSQYYVRSGGEKSGRSWFVSAEYGSYVAGTIDWDAEGNDLSIVVFTGSDGEVATMYATMQQLTDDVNAALYPFAPGINDCACFTGTMLDGIGIPRTLPMNTDGYTIWCSAALNTFTYEPGPRFPTLLESRLQWAEANNISDELGAAVFLAEAFIQDPWPSEPTAEKTAGFLAELDTWLEQTTGRKAATGSNSNESLTTTHAREVVVALAGGDAISALGGDDLIYGGEGTDTISAGAGNDLVDGGVGADKISGGAGKDRLAGGSGDDILTGSPGTDAFVFSDNGGSDTVTDFANGSEKFDLQAVAGLDSFSQLVLADTGPGVHVDYGTGSFLITNASNFSSIEATDCSP